MNKKQMKALLEYRALIRTYCIQKRHHVSAAQVEMARRAYHRAIGVRA